MKCVKLCTCNRIEDALEICSMCTQTHTHWHTHCAQTVIPDIRVEVLIHLYNVKFVRLSAVGCGILHRKEIDSTFRLALPNANGRRSSHQVGCFFSVVNLFAPEKLMRESNDGTHSKFSFRSLYSECRRLFDVCRWPCVLNGYILIYHLTKLSFI